MLYIIWLPCGLHLHAALQSTLKEYSTSQYHSAWACWVHNKYWLPSPFPPSSKYNRKMTTQWSLITSLRLFLGIPFIAFLCHYIGIQNTPFNTLSCTKQLQFACSIQIHTYMLWKKRKYTQILTAVQSCTT